MRQPSFKSGTASSQQVSETGVAGTEVNADLSGGMSGGPTVDSDTGEKGKFFFLDDDDQGQEESVVALSVRTVVENLVTSDLSAAAICRCALAAT